MAAICRSCAQPVDGAHKCPGFIRPSTSAAPSATTFPKPSLVLCRCGGSYRYGDSRSCVANATFFSTPSFELDPSIAVSLRRIAAVLERLYDKLDEE